MLELKNSKTTYLGKAPDGRDKFAIDGFIGAVQMREPDGEWVDIKPRLVRKPADDGYYVDRVPYYAEVNDDGSRLFCPDRNERSKFLLLPAIPLFTGLPRNIVSSPTKLDRQVLDSNVVMPTLWGEIRFIFTNTGMKFEVLFDEAPPKEILDDRFLFDHDTTGLDLIQLLSSKQGLGIPRPRLIDANGEERWLDWSLIAGQLELGFDLTGLKFPVLLKNTTIDIQVGASSDDCTRWGATSFYLLYSSFHLANESYDEHGARWAGLNIPSGSTIDVAYATITARYSDDGGGSCRIKGEKTAAPITFSTYGDYDARTRTTVYVDWTLPAFVANSEHNSPSLVSVIQEINDASAITHLVIFFSDPVISGTANGRGWAYNGSSTKAPQIYIEYSEAAAGAKRGWWSK